MPFDEPFARFADELSLPDADPLLLQHAKEAVRQEYRESTRWKRLQCRAVTPVESESGESLFVIEVGHAIEFDWTWEGATAFRPPDIQEFAGDADVADGILGTFNEEEDSHNSAIWKAEVVEVDETRGRIFVAVANPESRPHTGAFFVRPFEFLAFLQAIYSGSGLGLRDPLTSRLAATRGGIHPRVPSCADVGLVELAGLWQHGWSVLWGPPGTGKTHTLGQQISRVLRDPSERILVVSTTNRATDEAAVSIGNAARRAAPKEFFEGSIRRIGKGAQYKRFVDEKLENLLRGTETETLHQISELNRQLARTMQHEMRAEIRNHIRQLIRNMSNSAFELFVLPDVRVVVATAFKALTLVDDPAIKINLTSRMPPFTTIFIDESGLISRATTAALSLLASRRVILVGDAKQLAPISKISRVLPLNQATWLASSGLTHLQRPDQAGPAVHLLREQHRMHPDISRVVSAYQYEGALRDAPDVIARRYSLPSLLKLAPRAIWYVLDEDKDDLPSIRAERGPGNRSWIRKGTLRVLEKLLRDVGFRSANGLFISPFKAQAREISRFFSGEEISTWSASTVHSQQGTQADIVIFDTVNAGSCGWPLDEWKRLVNVGLSRAKEFMILLASRAEMNEPYLRPLLKTTSPRVLSRGVWHEVAAKRDFDVAPEVAANPEALGTQLKLRKSLRPVMSAEQQRLCGYRMDGKPRLVRGVAGSGKTVVLAHWLRKTVQDLESNPDGMVWAVFANKSLGPLIRDMIDEVWEVQDDGKAFPWHRTNLLHIQDILNQRLQNVGLNLANFGNGFGYDEAAAAYLQQVPADSVTPGCHAMFIDEAQDMGPNTLRLLTALVQPTDGDDPSRRAINIFYDNAQNIFHRKRPKWSELGVNIVGRAEVMKESFRSTRPITEYASNVLYQFHPPEADEDHKELLDRGLIEKTTRDGQAWFRVRFNQVEGPLPTFHKFQQSELDRQYEAVGDQIVFWIQREGVKPKDICLLFHKNANAASVRKFVEPKLKAIGVQLTIAKPRGLVRAENEVLASTVASFKGYESEVVVIPAVEQFVLMDVLATDLYVAMTRARSVLAIYGHPTNSSTVKKLIEVLETCLDRLVAHPKVEAETSRIDEVEGLLDSLGASKNDEIRKWLTKLWHDFDIQQEPIIASNGEIIAEPTFWFRHKDKTLACFAKNPGTAICYRLEDAGISLIDAGTSTI